MSTEKTDPAESPERNELQPVTLEAVATIFDEENLEYRLENNTLRSGFINAAIVCVVDDGHLIFEAIWRGEIPKNMASHVLFAVNEHNQTHFAPTLRFFENGEDHLAVSAIRAMDITHGASFNQLGAFLVSAIEATLGAFDYLGTTFPTLVTWEDHHHEH